MASKEKQVCEICKNQISKYKCPKCVIKYCSVSCFKSHKENDCHQKLSKTDNTIINATESQELLTNIPDLGIEETEDRVLPETFQCLRENPDLLVTLENPHLRSLMTNLVSSPSPAEDMERAMKEPIFLEFADQCLKVVDNNSQVKAGINVKSTG